ncbi:MAG: hypothetical protein HPY83_19530 [Anaerolineae bacterium]|nr:hypothetical protein [Anaerolineae bacterium]
MASHRRRLRLRGSLRQARRLPPCWPRKALDAVVDRLIEEDRDILEALGKL